MKNKTGSRQLSKKTLIYSIGTVTHLVAVLLAAPIFTRVLTTAEFGNYELSFALMFLLSTVGFLDINTSMLRFMYGETVEDDNTKNRSIYSSGILVLFFILMLFITVPIVAKITTFPFPKSGLFFGISFALATYYQNAARGKDRDLDYSLAFSIYHVVNLVTVVYMLVFKNFSSWALLVAMGIGHFVEIIFLEIRLKLLKNFKKDYIDIHLMKKILRFALPLAVSALGTWVLNYYTNIKIVEKMDSDANGIYSMALNIAKSIPAVSFGLLMAWQEVAFSFKGSLAEKEEYFSKAVENIIVFLSIFYIFFLSLATLIIPYYLDKSFIMVLNVLFLVAGCMTLETISNMIAGIFGNSINSKPLMISILVGAIIDLIILGPFIDKWGIYGAGYASLIGFGVTCVIRVVWIIKQEQLKINPLRISFYAMLSVLGAYIGKSRDVKLLLITTIISGSLLIINIRKNRSKTHEKDN